MRGMFRDVENSARVLSTGRRLFGCGGFTDIAVAIFSDCRSYQSGAAARDALGRVERDLLPSAFCGLQFVAVARRNFECRQRLFFWALVGLCDCRRRQRAKRRTGVHGWSLVCAAVV